MMMLSDRTRGGAEPAIASEVLPAKTEQIGEGPNYGRFLIEPLESGFGTTIGNALRRVLLSSLPGAAVTAVKIDQVQHEFSSIPHVREDTVELLLNIKKIRLKKWSDRPGRLVVDKQGPGVVTAADIEIQGDFEIVNPELYLATIDSSDGRLSIEFRVEHGKGYVPAGSQDGNSIGIIPVDAIFTPIRKVNYVVEQVRIGVSNYDKLIIELWSDGTIQPLDALSQAASNLIEHLKLIASTKQVARPGLKPAGPAALPADQANVAIEDLELSVRTYNALKRGGITKVGQVVAMSDEDLLAVRNFGRKSLDELRAKLIEHGFMAGDLPEIADDDSEESADDVELDMFGNPIADPRDLEDE